jgi:ankyrin repeat protein
MYASIIGDVSISKMLVENGADVNAQNQSGATALMLAAKYNHMKLCKMLVKSGADAKLKTTNKQSAFTIASQYGNYEVAEYLARVTDRSFQKATYF